VPWIDLGAEKEEEKKSDKKKRYVAANGLWLKERAKRIVCNHFFMRKWATHVSSLTMTQISTLCKGTLIDQEVFFAKMSTMEELVPPIASMREIRPHTGRMDVLNKMLHKWKFQGKGSSTLGKTLGKKNFPYFNSFVRKAWMASHARYILFTLRGQEQNYCAFADKRHKQQAKHQLGTVMFVVHPTHAEQKCVSRSSNSRGVSMETCYTNASSHGADSDSRYMLSETECFTLFHIKNPRDAKMITKYGSVKNRRLIQEVTDLEDEGMSIVQSHVGGKVEEEEGHDAGSSSSSSWRTKTVHSAHSHSSVHHTAEDKAIAVLLNGGTIDDAYKTQNAELAKETVDDDEYV